MPATTTLALAPAAVGQADGHEPFPAHKVIADAYDVGSTDLASYLIATPEGHILINSGFERTVPLIQKSVELLGFRMRDVKVLLASHAHADHVAGQAKMVSFRRAWKKCSPGDGLEGWPADADGFSRAVTGAHPMLGEGGRQRNSGK
jgi:glyoxylase-like metal-dependent hydrolase (beta-lactamase superfamily II)